MGLHIIIIIITPQKPKQQWWKLGIQACVRIVLQNHDALQKQSPPDGTAITARASPSLPPARRPFRSRPHQRFLPRLAKTGSPAHADHFNCVSDCNTAAGPR
ncbi:hypothetical protein M758_7G176400 [Ceratodon purpureus]|nr:hypothetical protein M758_7G176400 [Ceratodon purpureus]